MVNSSLAYEILLYINSFYFGLFATCQLGTLILKAVLLNTKYGDGNVLAMESGILVGLFIVESFRLYIGRKGSLSERDIPVMLSVLLTIPSILGVVYLVGFQKYTLRIEYIWCSLMLGLQASEFFFAMLFIMTMCRAPSYD